MMEKIKVFYFLMILVLSLSACGPSQTEISTQTSIAQTSIAALWTSTSPPTNTVTPSSTPSPTITPTQLPSKPTGANTFDPVRLLWTKTENDTIFYYNPETASWTTALNEKPIYLIDAKNYTTDVATALPKNYQSMSLFFYRMPDSEEPFISVEEPIEYDNNWFGDEFTSDRKVASSPHELLLMALTERINEVQEEELTAQMLRDSLKKIADRSLILTLDIPVDTSNNDQVVTKYWDPNNNIDIIQVPWKIAVADPSYFGQSRYDHKWKLDIRGGEDKEHPGSLVVFFSVPFSNRFKYDYSQANLNLLGPVYIAIQSQEKPHNGEVVFQRVVQDFTSSASHGHVYNEHVHYSFLEYKCNQFVDGNTQMILYCYASSSYLMFRNP
jgi:hypothetical protein